MMLDIHDEITLELARLQRVAFENVRKRIAAQQLGEAWVGLDQSSLIIINDRASSSDRL